MAKKAMHVTGEFDPGIGSASGVTRLEGRHIAAATLGNALEFYDFLTYAFFAIQIGHAFFPTQSIYGSLMLSLAIFGAGFVTRPIGAIVIGAYSDRVGRRPAMILSFTLIGSSILAMALIPPYAVIGLAAPVLAAVARLLQGFSLGGEVGANAAFLLEAAPQNKRGLTVSWQRASQLMAAIAGGVVGIVLSWVLSPDALEIYGWRIAFLLGAAAVPFGLWLRRSLPETLHGLGGDGVVPAIEPSRLHLLRRSWRIMLLGLVMIAGATIGAYSFSYIVTYAQGTLHMRAAAGFAAETSASMMGIVAVLCGGWLSDRVGRWRVNVWGNLTFLALIYPVFHWVVAARSEFTLIAGTTLLSAAFSFPIGSFFATLAESLPKSIRSSGFGSVYAVSIAVFGGTTQLMVTWLIHVTGSALAPGWYVLAAAAVTQVALILTPESAPVRIAARGGTDAAAAVPAEPGY